MSGIKTAFAMRKVGFGMLKTGRLNLLGFFRAGGIKEKSQLKQMLNKAYEIEDKRKDLS
ncbi:hypothetical protein SPONN_615 [uncultured Candidatus Thioglobus sp.]|nr:hypothetical protein SPONN_615 [uncultured Candidatus Thioglobus sp.]